jgi:hypothetical protein
MNRIILFVLFFISASPLVKSQSQFGNVQFNMDQYRSNNTYGRGNLTVDEIDGTPYLDYEFKVGTVLTADSISYKDIPLRYNCFNDALEFKKEKTSYDLQPKTKIKRAEFGGQVFTYRDFESDSGNDKSFFAILAEGKATLYARFNVKFYEPEPLKGFADAKPARFGDLTETYYVSIKNAPARKILSNKKLIEVLGDKQKEVETFISKQKLSIKKVNDLKKIIAYYNSL